MVGTGLVGLGLRSSSLTKSGLPGIFENGLGGGPGLPARTGGLNLGGAFQGAPPSPPDTGGGPFTGVFAALAFAFINGCNGSV